MSELLEFIGMTKRYGAATVLDNVSLRLSPGRVHALMGENGAGKSTLIKLIAGVVPADAMQVKKASAEIALRSSADAMAAGFRVLHQELNIVPQLSVAENILLGQPMPRRLGCLVNWAELSRRARSALAELGVDHISVTRQAGSLGTGDRMLVKIAAALVKNGGADACLYILDEPTAALNGAEAEKLFAVIARLKAQGAAILYVSHRMGEVMRISDDVTVLRNGRHIATSAIADTSRDEIIRQMTGREVSDSYPPRTGAIGTAIVVSAKAVRSPKLRGLDFELREGEILGLGGLAGAGQTELLKLFLGLETGEGGELRLAGRPVPANPAEAWARGVAYVPQERRSEGLMMRMGVRSNALLPHLTGLFAHLGRERRRTEALAGEVSLKSSGPEQSVWQLSGGNQQKVLFARILAGRPKLLLLDEPTRGVDVGARYEIYRLIRKVADSGCAVLMSSTDLPELLGLSDRILILGHGQQTGLIDPAGLSQADLLQRFYTAPTSLETV